MSVDPFEYSPLKLLRSWPKLEEFREGGNVAPVSVEFNLTNVCFVPGTMVLMGDGSVKPIEMIRPGEEVITHRGRVRRVLETFERPYEGRMMRVKAVGRPELLVTPEHPFLVNVSGKPSASRWETKKVGFGEEETHWMKASDLSERVWLATPKMVMEQEDSVDLAELLYGAPGIQFDEEGVHAESSRARALPVLLPLSAGLARLCGYFAAEGCTSKRSTGRYAAAHFAFHREEVGFIDDVRMLLKELFGEDSVVEPAAEGNGTRVTVYSRPIALLLETLCGKYARNKKFHRALMSKPELYIELLRGLFRGDGHARANGYELPVTSASLASQALMMLVTMGFAPTMYEQDRSESKIQKPDGSGLMETVRNLWCVRVLGEKAADLELKPGVTRTEHARSSGGMSGKVWCWLPVREIEEEQYAGSVFNLSVEDDESYVANWVAVHNCSHDCVWCSDLDRRMLHNRAMPAEVALPALKDMARLGLKAVTFEGGGEPTLSPCFDEAVALAQSLGLQVGLVTMGEFLDLKPGRLELVAKAMSWVRVSIDAAADTTHATLHRVKPGTLEKVWANIAKLRALNPDLSIGYSFVVSEHNWAEVVRAMEKAVELGCSYIQFKPVAMEHEKFWYTEQSNDLVKQAVVLAGDRIKVFAPRFEYDANERLVNRCYMHRFATHVGANGDVYACCYLPIRSGGLVKLGKRKEMEGVLGNLNQQSFTEIWEGKRRMAMVKALEESDHFVKKCPSCRFDRQNQMLHAIRSKGNSFL